MHLGATAYDGGIFAIPVIAVLSDVLQRFLALRPAAS